MITPRATWCLWSAYLVKRQIPVIIVIIIISWNSGLEHQASTSLLSPHYRAPITLRCLASMSYCPEISYSVIIHEIWKTCVAVYVRERERERKREREHTLLWRSGNGIYHHFVPIHSTWQLIFGTPSESESGESSMRQSLGVRHEHQFCQKRVHRHVRLRSLKHVLPVLFLRKILVFIFKSVCVHVCMCV